MQAANEFEPVCADRAPTAVPKLAARVSGIDYAFGAGEARRQVLFDINFEIATRQFVVLNGPSGAGKTTLLTLIGALRSVQKGSIEVLGHDLSRLGRRELAAVRRNLGFIFQTHNLFDALSAYENVKTAMQLADYSRSEMQRRGVDILERLGLGSRIDHKPRSLSTGECQRVAIARALVNRPRLILADEPTAALDRASTFKVLDLLREMTAEGAAVLMITHDHRIIERADRLIRLVDGKIVLDLMLTDVDEIRGLLRGTDLLRSLTPTQLTEVAQSAVRRHYSAGQTVLGPGEGGGDLLLIRSGAARLLREGREPVRLGHGDCLGGTMLRDPKLPTASIVAESDLDSYVVAEADLCAAMEQAPPPPGTLSRAPS
jgi:putative ABC transport system ATP-binding protein